VIFDHRTNKVVIVVAIIIIIILIIIIKALPFSNFQCYQMLPAFTTHHEPWNAPRRAMCTLR
jgi:hypothetical protein